MTDKEKIIKYLNHKGISKNEFYQTTGLSVGFLASGSSLGVDKLRLIIDNYHDLNFEWILTGKGEMLKATSVDNATRTIPPNEQHEKQNINMDETQLLRDMIAMLKTSNENQQKTIEMLQKQIDRMQTQNEELQSKIDSLRETAKRNKTAGAA